MFELAQHGVTVLVVNFIKVHITDKRFCNFMKKLLTRSDQDILKYPHLIGIRPCYIYVENDRSKESESKLGLPQRWPEHISRTVTAECWQGSFQRAPARQYQASPGQQANKTSQARQRSCPDQTWVRRSQRLTGLSRTRK